MPVLLESPRLGVFVTVSPGPRRPLSLPAPGRLALIVVLLVVHDIVDLFHILVINVVPVVIVVLVVSEGRLSEGPAAFALRDVVFLLLLLLSLVVPPPAL